MKQRLQFKFSQQLSMTPQLQQAIRLLQLSSLELQQEIQQALEENPLLEQAETEANEDDFDASDEPISDEWEEAYVTDVSEQGNHFDGPEFEYQGETTETLQDHLHWQMRLSHFSPDDEAIALAIIDSINDAGYLTTSLNELQEALNAEREEPLALAEFEVVLKRIQHFDPIGVGARDVSECLAIQLSACSACQEIRDKASRAVAEHLDLLAAHDYRMLARKLKLKEAELAEVVACIQSLNPRPGDTFQSAPDDYLVPDVVVKKQNNRWQVELNSQSMPKLKVNQTYADLVQDARNNDDTQYIKHQLQEAKWFIRSIESRNETLLKVASAIVQRQQAFFEYGEEAMKPMVLADIAGAIEMHESTVSRVTTQKYLHSPRGVFELKYFFSSQLATDNGECSSTAIRALLKKLVAAENPKKPLSDSKLTQLMADQGIQVARRTIAKYREALQIPPSSQRKRLI